MKEITILLVEDEEVLAGVVKETLELRGFSVRIARNGVEGWAEFQSSRPDVCVIDIMLPRKDGYSLVEDIRKVDEWIPVIFLTSKNRTEDVLKGLGIGADDYMKKPFSMEELILRIRSLIRRTGSQSPHSFSGPGPAVVSIGSYEFAYNRLELRKGSKTIQLSQREADLLHLLWLHKNQLLPRKTALLNIWGEDNIFTARSMDVYITRLRKSLADDPSLEILNIRGKGYKLIE